MNCAMHNAMRMSLKGSAGAPAAAVFCPAGSVAAASVMVPPLIPWRARPAPCSGPRILSYDCFHRKGSPTRKSLLRRGALWEGSLQRGARGGAPPFDVIGSRRRRGLTGREPMQREVLVTAGNGMFGHALIAALLGDERVKVRAMVRDRGKFKREAPNLDVVVADMDVPETLAVAVAGVTHVFLTAPMDARIAEREIAVLKAVQAAGGAHILKLFGAVRHEGDELHVQHGESLAYLKASGLPWTLVSPNSVMETSLLGYAEPLKFDCIMGMSGHGKVGLVAAEDVALAARAVILGDGHEGQNYELTGPAALNLYDVCDVFSRVLGAPGASPLEGAPVAPLERTPAAPAPGTRHWLPAAGARGLALFIGGFTLLSVIGAARSDALDANIWWVAVPFVPRLVSAALLAAVGAAFVAYAVAPRMRAWRRWPTLALFAFFAAAAVYNAVDFFFVWRAGDIAPRVPVPFLSL